MYIIDECDAFIGRFYHFSKHEMLAFPLKFNVQEYLVQQWFQYNSRSLYTSVVCC